MSWREHYDSMAELAARLDRCVDRAPIVRHAADALRGLPVREYETEPADRYRLASDIRDHAKLVAERWGAYEDSQALSDAAEVFDEVNAPRTPTYSEQRDAGRSVQDRYGFTLAVPKTERNAEQVAHLTRSSVIAGVAVTEYIDGEPPVELTVMTDKEQRGGYADVVRTHVAATFADAHNGIDPPPCDNCHGVGCSSCTDDDGLPL